MTKYSYSEALGNLRKEIGNNYDLVRKKNDLVKKPASHENIKPDWPETLQVFFSEVNGVNIHWQHFNFEDKPNVCGKINLLSAKKVADYGKGLIWFDKTPVDSSLKNFRILDFFADEASVGFFESDKTKDEMHLFNFEGSPIPLGINFEGYIRLLCEARGFFYWQQVLIDFKTNKENQESIDFKIYMPLIFPDFNIEDFKKKYQSLKID